MLKRKIIHKIINRFVENIKLKEARKLKIPNKEPKQREIQYNRERED